MCVLFAIILLSFSILLDTIATPDGPGTFLPMMVIIIPALFTVPLYLSCGLCVLAEVIYIMAIYTFKNNMLGQYDIFRSIVALAFSIIVANMIIMLRTRDYLIQTEYKYQSMMDALTNILNKEASFKAFNEYFKMYNPNVTCSLIIMDLDNFKTLNDTKGHTAGDMILHRVGLLLADTFRHLDIIGRFGGDEFVILLKYTASETMLQDRCRELQTNLRKISKLETGIEMTGSFGIVIVENQEAELQSLFDQADRALYEAKHQGRAGHVIKRYEPRRDSAG